ncbi:MAG TPA: hypothetical protein VLT82_01275 [Myxococcaceae bacterium]|nr:hypothetical protein [Myxococcaceae bacterium]
MQPERVDPPPTERPPVPPRKRFEELLRARTDRPVRKPPAPPRRQRTATSGRAPLEARPARAMGELRGQARKQMDDSARQRLSDGAVATTQATGRLEARSAELLRAALRTEEAARAETPGATSAAPRPASGRIAEALPVGPGVSTLAGGAATGAGGPGSASGDRVERALALVERIERFVRSGRPSLALTLRGGLPGQLELQRVAPGTIAVRLSSSRPPSARELDGLRQALEARGLTVRSLESRRLTASAADACSPCP